MTGGSESTRAACRVIASSTSWIDGAAVQQLERMAALDGMRLAVGLPDLHPGRHGPIGAAFVSEGCMYPALVGNDIGCGIGLWETSLEAARPRAEAWAKRLRGLDEPWDGDTTAWLGTRNVEPTAHDRALGTIGGGNHFAELQRVDGVHDATTLAALGVDPGRVLLLVHGGSRGLGDAILQEHVERHGAGPLAAGSEEAARYLGRHDQAMAWGRANRELIAERMLQCLGTDGRRVLDACHNFVEPCVLDGRAAWLHRKGAVPATVGPVVIPGSRGSFSYLVAPVDPSPRSAWSLAHGAGRKWSRTDSRAKLEGRFSPDDLTRTELGSRVICEDKDLLYEEAPQAYKKIDAVIDDLVSEGLARVVAVLRPIVTYKVRR